MFLIFILGLNLISCSSKSQNDSLSKNRLSSETIEIFKSFDLDISSILEEETPVDKMGKFSMESIVLAGKIGDINLIKRLIDIGADINTQNDEGGFTALMYAALNKHKDVVKFLLKNGADKNLINDGDETALDKARQIKNQDIINLLEKKY